MKLHQITWGLALTRKGRRCLNGNEPHEYLLLMFNYSYHRNKVRLPSRIAYETGKIIVSDMTICNRANEEISE